MILTSLVWLKHSSQLRRDVDRFLSVWPSDVDEHATLFVGAVQGVVDMRAGVSRILLPSILKLFTLNSLIPR